MNATVTKLVAVGTDEAKRAKWIEREARKILRYKAKGHRDFQGFDESSARAAAEKLSTFYAGQFTIYEEVPLNLAPLSLDAVRVRACSIICLGNPEWGTWGVMEDRGGWYEIHGRAGSRILHKSEATTSWAIMPA